MIDLADLLIGATALIHNIPIATLNIKYFERIEKHEILNNASRQQDGMFHCSPSFVTTCLEDSVEAEVRLIDLFVDSLDINPTGLKWIL